MFEFSSFFFSLSSKPIHCSMHALLGVHWAFNCLGHFLRKKKNIERKSVWLKVPLLWTVYAKNVCANSSIQPKPINNGRWDCHKRYNKATLKGSEDRGERERKKKSAKSQSEMQIRVKQNSNFTVRDANVKHANEANYDPFSLLLPFFFLSFFCSFLFCLILPSFKTA